MNFFNSVVIVAIMAAATSAYAQDTIVGEVVEEIDCDDPANAEHPDCLALLEPGVVGFAPLIGPGLGALLGLGAAALAAGDAATATPATPGT